MHDVGADDLGHRQREEQHHGETEERAAADRRQTDDEPADQTDPNSADPIGRRQAKHGLRRARMQERLDQERGSADQQRHTEHLLGRALPAVAIGVLQVRRNADSGEGHRRRAEQHPEGDGEVDGAELPVADGAERLEDRPVHDVRPDRHGRLEAEDEHQHRRHQRAAAHSGHAHQQADQQPGEGILEMHRADHTDRAYLIDKVSS